MMALHLALFGEIGGAFMSLAMPALQAAATILILQYQKGLHDDVAKKRIKLMDQAVTKYVNGIQACIDSGMFSEAFGRVPDAILYNPVDASEEQINAINANLKALPEARRQVEAVNRLTENNDITRMVALDPRYLCNINMASCQIKDLLAGKLPIDDVIEIVSDIAEQACMLGRIGNTKSLTMRSLGISRLRAQAMGRDAFERHNAMLNRDVSPIARQMTYAELLSTPQQRMALALTQNQLIQASLQNAANADAAGDPTEYAKIQIKLQLLNNALGVESNRGNMINQFVPNYAAILQPQIQSLTESLRWGGDAAVDNPSTPATPSATVRSADYAPAQTTTPQILSGGK